MNEETKNEARPENPDFLAASIESMAKVLEEVESEIRTAKFLVQNQESDKLKFVTLGRALFKIGAAVHSRLKGIIEADSATPGQGAFFTSKEALDVVTANPPIGAGKIPLGAEPWRNVPPDSIGIRASARLVQAWMVRGGASVDVRAVRVSTDTAESVSSWKVIASVDCEEAFVGVIYAGVLRANAVVKALRNALLSARLKGRRYRMNRAARAAAAAVAAAGSGQQAGSGKEDESHV